MPILNFEKQFVPLIQNEEKNSTIRAWRKVPIKKGDRLYLYCGLRTKDCFLIKEAICRETLPIIIYPRGMVLVDQKKLSIYQKDLLAYMDGFRSDLAGIEECFEVMYHWFLKYHELPFDGQIIYWKKFE